MEDFAIDAADALVADIGFDDIQAMDEAELKALEEKAEQETQQIEETIEKITQELEEIKDDEKATANLNFLISLFRDEDLLVDTIIGNLQGQPTNKVNLKFLLAKNKTLLGHFLFTMEDCTTFINNHEPRDLSMYEQSELVHVLKKMFLVFLYNNTERNPEGPKLDEEEEIKT